MEGRSNNMCVHAQSCQLFVTPQTIAHQVPLSVGFPRQEYWSGLPFSTPGDLPDPAIEPESLVSPALAGRFFATMPPGKPGNDIGKLINKVSCPMFLAQRMQEWRKPKSLPSWN